MKTQLKLMLLMIAVPLIVFTGCKKTDLHPGAKKFTGIGYFDANDACNSAKPGCRLCADYDWGS